MSTFISTENPEVIHSYQQEFQKILENSSRFFQQSDSPSQILEIFGSIMNTNITTNFALESHPCLALMSYGPDFVQALFENRDIDHSNSVYTQLVSILKQPQFAGMLVQIFSSEPESRISSKRFKTFFSTSSEKSPL